MLCCHSHPFLSTSVAQPSHTYSTNATSAVVQPPLYHLLRSWPDGSLLTVLKAAMAGVMSFDMLAKKGSTPRTSFALLGAVERRLADPAVAADLERQLSAAQAGQPPERQLQLPELRRLCLLEGSSAAAWMADNEASSVSVPLTSAFFGLMAAQLGVPPAAFGPPADKMAEGALAGYEQAMRLAPAHPRMAAYASNATRVVGGSVLKQVQLLELALRLAEEANRPLGVQGGA